MTKEKVGLTMELKPLKIIRKQNEYRIKEYVKHLNLVELDPEELTKIMKIKRKLFGKPKNPIYDNLTTIQKRVLHTIAPLWGNILQYNMEGTLIVHADNGNAYDLNSVSLYHCLVGEVWGFKYADCDVCMGYNVQFANLSSIWARNESNHNNIQGKLSGFLDHYYNIHFLEQTTELKDRET